MVSITYHIQMRICVGSETDESYSIRICSESLDVEQLTPSKASAASTRAMSHPQETLNVPNPEIGKDSLRPLYNVLTCSVGLDQHPQSAPNQAPPVSDFADGSGHIFSMYLGMATQEDKKMAEYWKADADGILIFVRIL